MRVDRFTLVIALLLAVVVVVVSASQYQQFALNENNSVKLGLINDALHNQTDDILSQLVDHRQVTNLTREVVESNAHYLRDTNEILHGILNESIVVYK